jgi:hypothetical protein
LFCAGAGLDRGEQDFGEAERKNASRDLPNHDRRSAARTGSGEIESIDVAYVFASLLQYI